MEAQWGSTLSLAACPIAPTPHDHMTQVYVKWDTHQTTAPSTSCILWTHVLVCYSPRNEQGWLVRSGNTCSQRKRYCRSCSNYLTFFYSFVFWCLQGCIFMSFDHWGRRNIKYFTYFIGVLLKNIHLGKVSDGNPCPQNISEWILKKDKLEKKQSNKSDEMWRKTSLLHVLIKLRRKFL